LGRLDRGRRPVERLLHGGCSRERAAVHIVDHLRVHVLVRTEHREARPFGSAAHLLAYAPVAALPRELPVSTHHRLTSPTCRPCAAPARRHIGCPCPCTARACGSCGCRRQPAPPAACRTHAR